MVRDWRDDRIEELERENAELRAQNGELDRRIRALLAQLARDSRNSSSPPSSDRPGAPPPAPPKRKGRKRGGQPGHKTHSRDMVPPERVTRTVVVKPEACRRCGDALTGDDAEPHRHQVVDVPKVVATVEEYQLHALDCPKCGISTRATLPLGVPVGNFGPRLQAIVSVCSGAYRMSKRAIEELVEDFFGVPIALGSLANLKLATSQAIEAPVAEVARAIREQPVVHADETGWYERRSSSNGCASTCGRLREGTACPVQAVAGRCREILELEPALWTFAYVEGVEPTNNAGEHRIRHGVMWRKTSFGTDSQSGSRFVERILTAVTTLRIEGRNVLDYVTECCQAVLLGRDAPSLLAD